MPGPRSGQLPQVRQQTLLLITLLNRWCQVREDLLFAFERSCESGLEEPMRTFVDELVTRIHGGMPVDAALRHFQDCSSQEQFQDFVIAMRFNFRYRGNLAALMDTLELQMNRIEEEYVRRRIGSARDRGLTIGIMAAAPILYLYFLLGSSVNRQFFLASGMGWLSLLVSLLFYSVGLACFASVSRQSR